MTAHPRRVAAALALGVLLAVPVTGFAAGVPLAPAPPAAPGPLPNGTLPNGTLPNGTLPNGTLPNETLPNGTLPNGTLPNGTLPNGTLPNGTLPNGTLPNGSRVGPAIPHFTDFTAAAGISGGFSRLAWGDYDSDGYDDVMFNGGVLYHNNRDGTFTDVSLLAGTRGDFSGGAWGDYNNDGRLDFYATAWRDTWDTLFRNNGDGTFTNVTAAAGKVTDDLPTEAAAWADYDRDGCLDLYAANYEWPPLNAQGDVSYGTPNILWHNNCDGTFSNATIAAGMYEDRRSRGVVWGDFNNDGWPDLYVSNYRVEPNELWQNNRNGTFANVAQARGVDCENLTGAPNPSGICGHSIGSDFADFNNDGTLDLFVANLDHPRIVPLGGDFSALYHNQGPPNYDFVNVRAASGVHFCETASDPTFGDFDGDGRPDLFVTSIYENRTNNLFRNDGADHFTDVTSTAGVAFDNGWGAGWSDFDRDGDLDLMVGSSSGAKLYRNDGNNASFIEIQLVGRATNRAGIGARVIVNANGASQLQEVQGGDGTGSQSSLRLFFGLGSFDGNASVQARWPSGLVQNLTLQAKGFYLLQEPEGVVDLAVANLTALPASPIVGGQVELTATVENVGSAPPQSGEVAFYRGAPTAANEIGRRSVGKLVGSQPFTVIFTAPSSPGPLTLLARVENVNPQDQNALNDQRSLTVNVRTANVPPLANLTAAPTTVQVGDPVAFDGSRSTDDSSITQYVFDFGDGTSSLQNGSTASHTYAQSGGFTARLTVIDDNGEPSQNNATVVITVLLPGQQKPTAIIDGIHPPSPEMQGAQVSFEGHGVASGSSVSRYEWTSNIDGALSDQATFQTARLSLGRHTISFRVQSADGIWSDSVTASYLIVSSGSVQITFIGFVNGSVLSGASTVGGTATPPAGVVVTKVEWRIDQSNLQLADGTSSWAFKVDPTQFPPGPHDITVVATDSDGLRTNRTIHVMFAQGGTPPVANFLAYVGLAVLGVLVVAAAVVLAMSRRAKRSRKAPPPAFPGLPVVAPPPPIRPLPVAPLLGPPGPPGAPKRRVKAVAIERKVAPPRSPG